MFRPIATVAPLLCVLAGCASGRDGYAYLPPLVPPVYPQPQDRKASRPPVQAVGQTSVQTVPPEGIIAGPPIGQAWPAPAFQPHPSAPPLGMMPGPAVLPAENCPP